MTTTPEVSESSPASPAGIRVINSLAELGWLNDVIAETGKPMSTGMPQGIWLNKFGVIVEQVFGHTPYQVGSSLKTKDWRDVDVRLILPDDEYDAMFGKQRLNYVDPKLAGLTLAFAALAKEMTGLPVDFQFQRQTHANKVYGGEWRSPLMECTPSDREVSTK